MRKVQCDGKKRVLLASVMMAALLAGCSSDVARFSDDPFASPFRSRSSDPATTNSINRRSAPAASQRPLEPVTNDTATTQSLPPPNQPILGANPARSNAGITTGSVSSANYPALTSEPPRPASVVGSTNGWSAVGGTPVTLQQGEGLNTLSQRYNVPVNALMAVNGLSSVNQVQPGQQIMIPAYNAVAGAKASELKASGIKASTTSAPGASSVIQRPPAVVQAMPAATAQSSALIPPKAVGPARQVTPATVSDAERRAAAKLKELKAPKTRAADDDEDEAPAAASKKKAEDLKRAEALKAEAAKKAAESKAKAEAEKAKATKLASAKKAKLDDDAVTTASIPETKAAARTQPMPGMSEPLKAEPAKTEPARETASVAPDAAEGASFRWPAKGRVISGFGARGTGGANDGINIALPEGTPVRAAESGTVVHADDALKGYGKLVLIRHPNGFVSVYAHNGELNVKRGESVKRGQVIAKSGQSGNVTAPQLHFEIRKGATPVDPTKHLGD